MPSTYTTSLSLTLPATGELSGTWGNTVNTGITALVDDSVAGTASITMVAADYTLTTTQGAANEARKMFITATGSPGAARNIIVPAVSKLYFVYNNTTGGFAQTVKTPSGSGVSVPNGARMVLYCNGTDVVNALNALSSLSYTGTLAGGTATFVSSIASTRAVQMSALAGYVSNLAILRSGYAEWFLGSTNNSAELKLSVNDEVHAAPVMVFDSAKNVGVGPTSPSVKFHVRDGSLADAFRVTSLVPGSPANNDTQQFASFQATTGTAGVTFSGADPRLLSLTVTTNNEIAFRANKPMLLGTSYVALGVTTEGMRIDSSNNVGIGTSSPVSALGFGEAASATGVTFQSTNTTFNSGKVAVIKASVAGSGNGSLIFETYAGGSGGTERLRITSTGAITSSDLADAVGYKGTPINEQLADYTLVMADQGKTILHPIADNNARTFTIPANGAVAFPVGTVITFINLINTVTISINSDTMYLAGTGATGSRTLAAYGMASAIKVSGAVWVISGNGLT